MENSEKTKRLMDEVLKELMEMSEEEFKAKCDELDKEIAEGKRESIGELIKPFLNK